MITKHLRWGSTAPPIVPGKIRLYSMRFAKNKSRFRYEKNSDIAFRYDVVYVNLFPKPEWFSEKSQSGKVPCTELEGGETLYESLIIADYLDEAYPQNKLYPMDPLAKAKDKLLIQKFHGIVRNIYNLYAATMLDLDLFNEKLSSLDLFDRELVKRRTAFFGGSSPGMLDLIIWPWCEGADVLSILREDEFFIPRERFIRLFEWRNAMKEDPGVKGSYLDAEVHAKYLCSRLAGFPQYDLLINTSRK